MLSLGNVLNQKQGRNHCPQFFSRSTDRNVRYRIGFDVLDRFAALNFASPTAPNSTRQTVHYHSSEKVSNYASLFCLCLKGTIIRTTNLIANNTKTTTPHQLPESPKSRSRLFLLAVPR